MLRRLLNYALLFTISLSIHASIQKNIDRQAALSGSQQPLSTPRTVSAPDFRTPSTPKAESPKKKPNLMAKLELLQELNPQVVTAKTTSLWQNVKNAVQQSYFRFSKLIVQLFREARLRYVPLSPSGVNPFGAVIYPIFDLYQRKFVLLYRYERVQSDRTKIRETVITEKNLSLLPPYLHRQVVVQLRLGSSSFVPSMIRYDNFGSTWNVLYENRPGILLYVQQNLYSGHLMPLEKLQSIAYRLTKEVRALHRKGVVTNGLTLEVLQYAEELTSENVQLSLSQFNCAVALKPLPNGLYDGRIPLPCADLNYLPPEYANYPYEMVKKEIPTILKTHVHVITPELKSALMDAIKAEVYALGLIVFELITGHKLYDINPEASWSNLQWLNERLRPITTYCPVSPQEQALPDHRESCKRLGRLADPKFRLALDWLSRALRPNPEMRATAEGLMLHPWLRSKSSTSV